MLPIYSHSATAIAKKIQSREWTCLEVAQAFIARISFVNPTLNALQQFQPKRILDAAEVADQRLSKGKALGRLHGVPITIKDALYVKGFAGSKGFRGFLNGPASYDATLVARLKQEGALLLGITNTSELLMSYETDNLIYGRTVNPYDFSKVPGGSSGGEAALIAAGGSPLGIGTDAGGSIRQPAHYCGICGHKPTQFIVPLTGDIPFNGSAGLITEIITAGPMSRHIEDLILTLDIIAGPDGLDPHVPEFKLKPIDSVETEKLKIAYFYSIGETTPCEDTVKALNAVLSLIRSKGMRVKEATPPNIEDTFKLHWETFFWGGDRGAALIELYKATGQTEKSPLAAIFVEKAAEFAMDMASFKGRMIEVERFRTGMAEFMKEFDLIICPVAATPARAHGETPQHLKDFVYTNAFNLSGFPATVLPCGFSKTRLPIGLQVVAKPFHDHVSLAFAKMLQSELGVFPIPELDAAGK